jgi:hypothetical protein
MANFLLGFCFASVLWLLCIFAIAWVFESGNQIDKATTEDVNQNHSLRDSPK